MPHLVVAVISLSSVVVATGCRRSGNAGSAATSAEPQAASAGKSAEPQAWATDWSAFVKELSVVDAKDAGKFTANVTAAFHGKRVTWTGKVASLAPPPKSGMISISMPYLEFNGIPFVNLILIPGANEWKTWESVAVGDTVLFATTLDKGEDYVVGFMTLPTLTPGEEQRWVRTRTKGGSCLRVVAQGKKENGGRP